MTQYAKQDKKLFYVGEDYIEKGLYECISCRYVLEPVFKDGVCTHFKHEANSRKAHLLAHGELCSQMSTNFKGSEAIQEEKAYKENTLQTLIQQAEDGDLDPQVVIHHLKLLYDYIQKTSAKWVDLRAIERDFEERDRVLKNRERDLKKEETYLHYLALRYLYNREDVSKNLVGDEVGCKSKNIPPFRFEEVLQKKAEAFTK